MANEEHLAILRKGVEEWNAWRRNPETMMTYGSANFRVDQRGRHNVVRTDLSCANLSQLFLRRANLAHSDLREAQLVRADLSCAELVHANLQDALITGANLEGAHLDGANLASANLQRSNLLGVGFNAAVLKGTDFTGAVIGHADFGSCDLSEARGLKTVAHHGPSTIGIDTLYKSGGRISEVFLRGCGVPESFITQMRSLVGAEDGIQFYSCFISYSGKDEEFATRLHGKMRDAHLRVWFAPEDMPGGKKLHEEIETAIRVFDKLLIVLTEASIRSDWVMDELRKGFKAERQSGQRKLFPVRLCSYETLAAWECRDSQTGKDLAEEVRQYFIPDFSQWKDHDPFEASFARLLKDLKAPA